MRKSIIYKIQYFLVVKIEIFLYSSIHPYLLDPIEIVENREPNVTTRPQHSFLFSYTHTYFDKFCFIFQTDCHEISVVNSFIFLNQWNVLFCANILLRSYSLSYFHFLMQSASLTPQIQRPQYTYISTAFILFSCSFLHNQLLLRYSRVEIITNSYFLALTFLSISAMYLPSLLNTVSKIKV